jgi:hypothetical protein
MAYVHRRSEYEVPASAALLGTMMGVMRERGGEKRKGRRRREGGEGREIGYAFTSVYPGCCSLCDSM